jgi:multicomponent Na+:H+ antiporter subunit D
VSVWLAWAVAVPLAGACAALFLPRAAARIGMAASLATAGAAAAVVGAVWHGGVLRHPLGGWSAPLGIELRADGLSALMLVMTAVTSLPVGIYATRYFEPREAAEDGGEGEGWTAPAAYWPLALFLWAALNALFLSGDVFNLYVTLELMTLAAVALVTLGERPVSLTAGMRYLLAGFLGSLGYLLGVALLYGQAGTLDLVLLADRLVPGPPAWAAVGLITAGLALKSALFPLHFWLPRAHASAPAPVSALLSALVVTATAYLVLRLWVQVFAPVTGAAAVQVVGALGAGAILWGSVQAIRQQQLKIMIAYSTVAQVGYLFLVVPLVYSTSTDPAPWRWDAWSGGVYHALSHAFAKAAMFLAAGSIIRALGSDRIVGISGIAAHLPVSTYAFGIAGMSLIGLPPSGGFVAKWLLLTASLASGQWWWGVVILVGGVLTAGYVFIVLSQELSQAESDAEPRFRPVPRRMEYAAMVLALLALGMGLRAAEPLLLLGIGSAVAAPVAGTP